MKYDKAKSIGIIVGIIISVFLIGQQLGTLQFLTRLMGGLINYSNYETRDIWVVDELTKNINSLNPIDIRYVQELKSIEGVSHTYPLLISPAPATFKNGKTASVLLVGSESPDFMAGPSRDVIYEGNIEDLSESGNVSVEFFNTRSWKTPLKVGDSFEINKKNATIRVMTKYAQGYGGNFVFTNLSTARFFTRYDIDKISAVVIKVQDGIDPQDVCDRINKTFMGISARVATDLRNLTVSEILVSTNTGVSFGSLIIFAIISGFFIIGLTQYSFVLDRLQDYGTLKAIGANNAYVRKLIILQALLYALIGYSIAYLLLLLFKSGVAKAGLTLDYGIPMALLLLGITIFMSVGGSLFALFKINKVEPASVF